jgi:hypothetical protein
MIVEISIENFLSMKNKVKFSLDSNGSNKLKENLIILDDNKRLLKSAVIYGANASGKSNLIKSLFFIWNMIKNSHNFNIETKIPRIPFKLNKSNITKPSSFEIIFIHNNIKYKYGFSCDNLRFIDEYLFYWPQGRQALVFKRTNCSTYEYNIDKKKQSLIKLQMNNNVLYLSRATQLGYDKVKPAYEFFVENMVINYGPAWQDFTINQIYQNVTLRKKIIDILQKADFGGILDIKINKEKKRVNGFEFKIEKDMPSFNPIKQKEQEFFNIKFIHQSQKGELIEFNMDEESHGTQKTLSMLGPIFDILENGKVAFIDEFELNLHPNITRFLVRLFNSKNNKRNAQLVITTHDTTLLDNELFRRDQIYICSKEPNRNTILSSFLDYNLRESTDFERAYLNGRVGGLPFIDETLFD